MRMKSDARSLLPVAVSRQVLVKKIHHRILEEAEAFLTSSLSNLPEKTDKIEESKKTNSFLHLFSRKPTPSSLENLPLKVSFSVS